MVTGRFFAIGALIRDTVRFVDSHNWIAFYSKNLNDILEPASNCTSCVPTSGVDSPLYTIDDDKYNIKDLYHTHDEYKKDDKILIQQASEELKMKKKRESKKGYKKQEKIKMSK